MNFNRNKLKRNLFYKPWANKWWLEKVVDSIPCSEILLDIGAGWPIHVDFKRYLFSTKVKEYIALDISNHRNKALNVVADGFHLPFRNKTINLVLLLQVLEHVPEPKDLLVEIHRVMKNESFLIASAPHVSHLHYEPSDYYRYTEYGLKYLFKKSGFQMLNIMPQSGVFGVIYNILVNNVLRERKRSSIMTLLQLFLLLLLRNLDKFDKERKITLNYFCIARKINVAK